MAIPGFSITIHQSLSQPILLAGVPRQFAILNGTVAAATTFGLQSLYALPICFALHWIAVILTKRDPYFFSVILRHLRQKKFYSV